MQLRILVLGAKKFILKITIAISSMKMAHRPDEIRCKFNYVFSERNCASQLTAIPGRLKTMKYALEDPECQGMKVAL